MKKQQPISAALAIAATIVLASAGTLLANGQAFFVPEDRGPVELAYFARVKDARTGKPIQKPPYVTIVDPFTGIYMPFQGDGPGHFRSPDIGAAILQVASRPIDPKRLEIIVSASGYKTVKVTSIPRQSTGAVELFVKMEPKEGGIAPPSSETANQSAASATSTTPPTDSSTPTFILLGACFGLAAISGVARTIGRRDSTAH